jgi:hypothetical protein
MGTESLQIQFAALSGLSARRGVRGDWLHGFRLVEFLPTGCSFLVHGIRLVLLRAGDVESNPGPDRGPCVVCGLKPVENAGELLRCRKGCGMESHYKEACSGLRRGEQRQGNWACGMCVVVNGEVAPPHPQSSQVPPPAALSQSFGQVSPSSQPGPCSHTKPHDLVHQFAPVRSAVPAGAAQCPTGRGGRVDPVVPNPGVGRGGWGMLALEAALVLELGFPLNLGLGLAPRSAPTCAR